MVLGWAGRGLISVSVFPLTGSLSDRPKGHCCSKKCNPVWHTSGILPSHWDIIYPLTDN